MVGVVLALGRRLPRHERDEVMLALGDDDTGTDPEPEVEEDVEVERGAPDLDGGDGPDWEWIWRMLLVAHALTERVNRIVRDDRMYVAVGELAAATTRLRQQLDETYELLCHAPRLDGVPVQRGEDVAVLRRRVDIRRAEMVEEELDTVRPSAVDPAAPTWTIECQQHGGFLATCPQPPEPDGGSPSLLWGGACTPGAAAHAVRTYVQDTAPPAIVFEPPVEAAQPLVTWFSPASDRSLDNQRPGDLLARGGAIYDEHIAACHQIQDSLRGTNVGQVLSERAAELNTAAPQLPEDLDRALRDVGAPTNRDYRAFVEGTQWVPSRLVVATGCPAWNEFGGHRPEVPHQIAQALANASDLHQFTRTLFSDPIDLVRIPAWAGPIYLRGSNGTHRIHTARMLGLPWLPAEVRVHSEPPAWDVLGILTRDPHGYARDGIRQRSRNRAALITGLIQRGIIDGELHDPGSGRSPVLRCRAMPPAPWLVRSAECATTINAAYERAYPGALRHLSIPDGIGTDPDAWTDWLTT